MEAMSLFLIIIMVIVSFLAVNMKDLLSASILLGFVSLMSAVLFYFMQAPDVAMAEASIGAALTTAVFIVAIKKTKRFEEKDE